MSAPSPTQDSTREEVLCHAPSFTFACSFGYVQGRYRLAQCYLAIGKTQLAKENVSKVLERDPKNADTLKLVSP